jgi:uncharacterized repeat protein (TIGR03803 family)
VMFVSLAALLSLAGTSPAQTVTTVDTFTTTDGEAPTYVTSVQDHGADLVGTTEDGGSSGDGVLFSFTPSNQTLTLLRNFGSVGKFPESAPILTSNGRRLSLP